MSNTSTTKKSTQPDPAAPPCECGQPDAYWLGDTMRVYLCDACHAVRNVHRAFEKLDRASANAERVFRTLRSFDEE